MGIWAGGIAISDCENWDMNIAYSGNSDDLFKFDLATDITKAMAYSGITYVPMPTASARINKNKKAAKDPYIESPLLANCLKDLYSLPAYFHELHAYFKVCGLEFLVHKPDSVISGTSDFNTYFDGINLDSGTPRLILADPDSGLEPIKRTIRHLSYEETSRLIIGMNSRSLLMIYQRSPRNAAQESVYGPDARCAKIKESTPVTIHTCRISIKPAKTHFIFCSKDAKTAKTAEAALKEYSRKCKGAECNA